MASPRKRILLLGLFLLLPLLARTAFADLTDPCDSTGGPGEYRGLEEPEEDYIAWSDPPDGSYLCQSSNRREAEAVYHVPGAVRAEISIYSRYGSYASAAGDGWTRGGEDRALRYDPDSDEVYCGDWRLVYDAAARDFAFIEEEAPSGLENYGLTVYASEDGESYYEVPASLLSAETEGGGAYWYETYEVELSGENYLRLTLTDQSSVEILGRAERYEFESTGGLSLASVEVECEDLPEDASDGNIQFPEEDESGSDPDDIHWEEPPDPELPEGLTHPSEPMDFPEATADFPAFPDELPEDASEASSQPEAASSQSETSPPPASSGGSGGGGAGDREPAPGGGEGEGSPRTEGASLAPGMVPLSDYTLAEPETTPLERLLSPDIFPWILLLTAVLLAAVLLRREKRRMARDEKKYREYRKHRDASPPRDLL